MEVVTLVNKIGEVIRVEGVKTQKDAIRTANKLLIKYPSYTVCINNIIYKPKVEA